MKYLITTTEVYRVDEEGAATALIDSAKHDSSYDLMKYSSTKKERKSKGEVIDSWYQVSLTKSFNDEKDPISDVNVRYVNAGDF